MQNEYNLTRNPVSSNDSSLSANKLIRNTYALLSMTLLCSAVTAGFAMASGAAPINIWINLVILFGTLFALNKVKNSGWALPLVFLFTGFMGYTAGPIINYYLALPNGSVIVTTALSLTSMIFLGLSLYALTSRKDFSFMRDFLFIGLLVVIAFSLANIFLQISMLSLAISSAGVIVFSGLILFDTSRMVHGGEKNYIMITVSLYLSIYNLFFMLLHLTGFFNSSD